VWGLSAHEECRRHYEVTVDGKPRTYRNVKAAAIVAAEYLKRHNPNVEVAVRDLDSGETTVIKNLSPK
jgi:hypothetical protein